MTLKNGWFLLTAVAATAIFSGCYTHSSHYPASYGYYEPAYVEEVYVEAPVAYHSYEHHKHCY